jgi:hypothetical protein
MPVNYAPETLPHGLIANQILAKPLGTRTPRAYVDRTDETLTPTSVISSLSPVDNSAAPKPDLGGFGATSLLVVGASLILGASIAARLANIESDATSYSAWSGETALPQFRALLRGRRSALSPDRYAALERQLSALLGDEAELTAANLKPSVLSFEGLIQFLRSDVRISHPNLALGDGGYFVASWSPHRRAKLSITFKTLQGGTWVAADRTTGAGDSGSGPFAAAKISIPQKFAAWMYA